MALQLDIDTSCEVFFWLHVSASNSQHVPAGRAINLQKPTLLHRQLTAVFVHCLTSGSELSCTFGPELDLGFQHQQQA